VRAIAVQRAVSLESAVQRTLALVDAIAHALLAIMAWEQDDTAAAQRHIANAQRHGRMAARRDRQIVEIAGLVVAGAHERAAGLALVHAAEFPDDADLLIRS
jgi:hypothetical protein